MRKAFLALSLLIFLLPALLNAQSIVKGRVFDLGSGESLPGVYVLFGKSTGTTTDEQGFYSITCDSGQVNITFKFVGYKTVTKTVNLSGHLPFELNAGLETDALAIDQIVVSADRMEQKVSELTVSMDVIRNDYLERSHISDAKELITKTPGIEVLDGQASIRGGSGFSYGVGSRVLALLDGLPLMSADAGGIKWNFLPFENLSQVEIIKGASSVMYGSSALNGVINFRTADATNIPVTTFYAEGGIFGKSGNEEWVWWDEPRMFTNISFSHLRKSGNTDVGVGLSLSADNGYRKYNFENLGRLNIRLKHYSKKFEGLRYGVNLGGGTTWKADFILWEDAEKGALKQDTSTVAKLRGYLLTVDPFLSYNKTNRFRHDLRIRFQSSANRFPVRTNNDAGYVSLYGEYQLWYRLFGFMDITAGVSETWNKVISNFYGDHDGLNLAGFAQIEVRPVERLKVVGGLRIEQNILDGENDKVVPVFRAGVNWQVADFTFIRASFGQGYRYPSIAEKHAATTLGSVKVFPNPFIEAESGWSSEIGIKQGLMIGSVKGQGDLSFFFSQNSDMIEYLFGIFPDPVTGISGLGFQASNVEQSRVYGTEAEMLLGRSFGAMEATLSGGYTYIYPVEFNSYTHQNTDLYLKYRRKHTAKLGFFLTRKRFDAGFDLYARSKILRIDDVFLHPDTRELILPGFYDYWQTHNTGYFAMDVNAGYRLNGTLTLSISVKNITNTEYMGRPGDIQPHRNFSIRLSGKF
ncbi:MAG: TonB-dependent receptor [Bacteroidales bacterium]|jgi:iron complex outermembrane receptor protein|nr:TonB-dependent receptor [Bacteroidales bacterium]